MVPAFGLIVKRQRHDQLVAVFLERHRLQLAQGLHGADKFLGSFPVPRCLGCQEGCQRLVACIAHGVGRKVDEIVVQDEVAKEVNLVFDGAGTGSFVGVAGLIIDVDAVISEHLVVRHDLLVAAGAHLPLVSLVPCR